MRRFLIRQTLPLLICSMALAGAVLVVVAVPPRAWEFYLKSIRDSYIDWIILAIGIPFFLAQLFLTWQALRWRERSFDEWPDRWIQRFHEAADWFPLLGLLGTVAGILQTFGAVGEHGMLTQTQIIELYAPALTTTASGLLMAFLNVVPMWLVSMGRGLIGSLAAMPAREA